MAKRDIVTPVKVVKKPWGEERWIAVTDRYVGKLLIIKKGHRLSKQYHRVKHETLYTDQGRYLLEFNGKNYVMNPGDAVVVKPGSVHRMYAKFGDVRIIEVSTTELDDVVRLDDDYGRSPDKGKGSAQEAGRKIVRRR
jgi:mannose-6-phosphate isomerase